MARGGKVLAACQLKFDVAKIQTLTAGDSW